MKMWSHQNGFGTLIIFGTILLIPVADSICSDSISASSGYIFSPTKDNTPLTSTTALAASHGNYPDNSDCTYTITAPAGNVIKLSWITFDVKGTMPTCWPKDYVEIYIGCSRKSIGKYCDTNSKEPFDMYSPDNCMQIKFKSDGSDSGTGFMARFISYRRSKELLTDTCSSSSSYGKTMTASSGTISSPRWPYPFMAVGRSCYWRIEVGSSRGIKLAVMDFDLPYDFGCDDSKLKIKGDDDYSTYSRADRTIKDSICGSRSPFYITTTEKYVWIRFKRSYSNVNRNRGFVAGYVRYTQSIHDTGTQITGAVVGIVIAIVFIGCIVFICVRRRRAARNRPPPAVMQAQQIPLAPPQTQSYPMQPPPGPPGGQIPPPPSYGQATGGYYPPPGYPQKPTGYNPVPPGEAPYPPPQGAPYPAPDGSPVPYPAAPYPTPQWDVPPAPYPTPQGGASPYPADTSAPPYPTAPAQQPYPPPGQAPYPPPQ